MSHRTLCFLLLLIVGALCAQSEHELPQWLDTIPPVITPVPSQRYHNGVFLVALRSNKQAALEYRVGSTGPFLPYETPLTISREGVTVLHFRAEDAFGNASQPDSVVYVLDTRPPRVDVAPRPGRYRTPVTLLLNANKPVRFLLHEHSDDTGGTVIASGMVVQDSLSGYITAHDSAGNRTTIGPLLYRIDTSRVVVTIVPRPGLYNSLQTMALRSSPQAQLFYSLDPTAPPEWFVPYRQGVPLPHGLTVVRYCARDDDGWQSPVEQATFVIDTIPPRLRVRHRPGLQHDTLELHVRKPSLIRYELGGQIPDDGSPVYREPLLVPRKGLVRLRAFARDSAGNRSEVVSFEHRYDTIPAVVSITPDGGAFREPVTVRIHSSKPSRFFYTVDGSPPTMRSLPSTGTILISRQGETHLRLIGVDNAENLSAEVDAHFIVDSEPARVRTRIEPTDEQDHYLVYLETDPGAVIHYTIGTSTPQRSSPVYHDPLLLRTGEELRYFTVDRVGNVGPVSRMDELLAPSATPFPRGGLYNRPLALTFDAGTGTRVYYRQLPDTAFSPFVDTLHLRQSGNYVLEYFSRTAAGLQSALRRENYRLDLSAPVVSVSVRKGIGDTAFILFEADKNATFYYTIDGTNPFYSATTGAAGNRLIQSRGRVKVVRTQDLKLAFYAEDAVGNRSRLTVLDVFQPRAVPGVPAGPQYLYDRPLSIALNTFEPSSVIHYARGGRTPTVDSAVYRDPITLLASDTICAFVIDPSGYIGQVDTFVYLIDLPPVPHLKVTPHPDSAMIAEPVFFDASESFDRETPHHLLRYRWDFSGNGVFETHYDTAARVRHVYELPGLYHPVVEVLDGKKRSAITRLELRVRDHCPAGMVYVVAGGGASFCMDRYEWPNLPGHPPFSDISWVEAKMLCLEAGKRLCTAREWESACRGRSRLTYPYGSRYEEGVCATEGDSPYAAGSFASCGEGFGLRDMIGNVWEWVEDKHEGYPLMMGGAWMSGGSAHCGLKSEGTVGTRSSQIGFRCCR